MNTFWDKYYQKPLDEIPWQNTQADWFKKLIDDGAITGDSALDLGCGTGKKSVYLAQHAGFKKIIGVDISKQAIKYAKANARDARVKGICSFATGDLSSDKWPFIGNDETFDFILDWAAIHCMAPGKIKKYAANIERHCKTGGKFLARSFTSKNKGKGYFTGTIDGIKSKVYLRNEKDLSALLPRFRILAENTSQPDKSKSEAGYYFIELLMRKNRL